MKIFLSVVLMFLISYNLLAQENTEEKPNTFGIKAGIIDVSLYREIGPNVEVYYERALKHGFFLGLNAGVGKYNNFPEEFNTYPGRILDGVGVPEAINEQIIGMQADDALLYGFNRRSVAYGQLYLKYQAPIKILGNGIHAILGLMHNHTETVSFGLGNFSYMHSDNKVYEYETTYHLGYYSSLGWTVGFGIEREMARDFVFSADAKYNLLFGYRQMEDPSGLIRVGIGKRFK